MRFCGRGYEGVVQWAWLMVYSLGGMDIRVVDPCWFRSHVGIVSQEPVLFARSIKDNIAFGKDDATMEQV